MTGYRTPNESAEWPWPGKALDPLRARGEMGGEPKGLKAGQSRSSARSLGSGNSLLGSLVVIDPDFRFHFVVFTFQGY